MTERDATSVLPPAALAELLAASAATIAAEMQALGGDATWHPAPGEWCANEVLGHVLEAERRGFNGRIRTLLAEDGAALKGWDQLAVAAERRDCERDPEALLGEFRSLRSDSVDLVRSLDPRDLERSGVHDRVGLLRIGDVIAEWVHHDRNHARQILANSQARVWPQMGNARRFSDPSDPGSGD
jgi:DinB superfamily